ncbi:MAG: NADAR family protein [Pacificimonas sp.]
MDDEVRFYRASEKPYGAFSNLYRREIEFEGNVYATSEHAYQAGKARKEAVREWLMAAPSPSLLAMAAHGLYYWDVAPGWSKTKFERMRRVLRAKFDQHEDLKDLLLSTGDARLVESATVDNEVNRLWGEVDGVGKNTLGIMLMELREELRTELSSDQRVAAVA